MIVTADASTATRVCARATPRCRSVDPARDDAGDGRYKPDGGLRAELASPKGQSRRRPNETDRARQDGQRLDWAPDESSEYKGKPERSLSTAACGTRMQSTVACTGPLYRRSVPPKNPPQLSRVIRRSSLHRGRPWSDVETSRHASSGRLTRSKVNRSANRLHRTSAR